MAKKKPDPPKRAGRPKLANPKPLMPVVVTLRGKPEWLAWLDEIRGRIPTTGKPLDRTDLIDHALKKLAEQMKLPAPPSRL